MQLLRTTGLTIVLTVFIASIALPSDALHIQCMVSDLRNLRIDSFVPFLPNMLEDVQSIQMLVSMIKGGWMGLTQLVIMSCEGWSEDAFKTVRQFTQGSPHLQSYLLSPSCVTLLPFAPPSDFSIENDGYSALPINRPTFISTFIKALKILSWVDPYCWYRFYLPTHFETFLGRHVRSLEKK